MLNGITYMVRPRMQPSKRESSVARISAGGAQLLVGPASSLLSEQTKVRSSTRATSEECERARKELGRLSGLRRMNVPDSTICAHSRSYSSTEPSAQWTLSGLQSCRMWPTQARRRPTGTLASLSIVVRPLQARADRLKDPEGTNPDGDRRSSSAPALCRPG